MHHCKWQGHLEPDVTAQTASADCSRFGFGYRRTIIYRSRIVRRVVVMLWQVVGDVVPGRLGGDKDVCRNCRAIVMRPGRDVHEPAGIVCVRYHRAADLAMAVVGGFGWSGKVPGYAAAQSSTFTHEFCPRSLLRYPDSESILFQAGCSITHDLRYYPFLSIGRGP